MSLVPQSRNLQRRSFRGQNLSGSNFRGFNLSGADFTDAILDGADLSHADLRGTVFRRSSLIGVNLSYSRSGVPIERMLVLQAFLLILAVLLGLLAGFVGSSTTGLLTNESQVFQPYEQIKFPIPWHTMSGLLAVSYSIVFGFILLLRSRVAAIVLGVGSIILINTVVVGSIIYACEQANQPWDFVGYMSIAVGGSAMLVIFQGIFTTICLAIAIGTMNRHQYVLPAAIIGGFIALSSVINVNSSSYVQLGTILGSSAIICMSFRIGNRNRSNQQKYDSINTIATYFATLNGTCFDRANLTEANLEHALLNNANLSRANLQQTNFYGARQLDFAKIDRTILLDPAVRNLLVTNLGSDHNYQNCNLHGAYLVGADLSRANLTGADIRSANLTDAQLNHANLTRVLASNTNFQTATFTGACIADWSIDRTTKLADICCDYIYLKAPDRERSPVSGNFASGDFTRIFQEIWNTMELIFQQGVDWTSFNHAWQQIQIENQGIPLAIHSIDRKGEGMIVVQVEIPPATDKIQLHQDFNAAYQLQLQALVDRHQVELAGRDAQIERLHQRELVFYKEQQDQLNHVLQSLVDSAKIKPLLEQLVVIKLGARNINHHLAVTVEIGDRGLSPRAVASGILGCEQEVIAAYQAWQVAYRDYLGSSCRIDVSDLQITNLTKLNSSTACLAQAEYLSQRINQWLNSSEFRPIKDLMLQELKSDQLIQIIWQTDNLNIRQLPLQLWNFFEQFPQAELAVSGTNYRAIHTNIPTKNLIQPGKLKVLAIFGDRQGLDFDLDHYLLTDLPNATVELLIEPSRQILNDKLWAQPWDAIFFTGHSRSNANLSTGYLKLNPTDRLTIPELKYALQKSIANGLKLIIINSCDGLGLATELISIQVPQTIVMREPIPNFVAQQFLNSFLTAFTSGLSLYQSVRQAREQLQGVEDKYPCASWLPVICQNPAAMIC